MAAETDAAKLAAGLADPDSAVRYWAAVRHLIRTNAAPLLPLLNDPAPAVRIVAAETVGRYGAPADLGAALAVLVDLADMEKHGVFVALQALNALDHLDAKAAPVKAQLQALPRQKQGAPQKLREYVPRLLETVLEDLP
jgi:HEAT repeat protein